MAREGTKKRSLFRYAELSETSLLEVWLGEKGTMKRSLFRYAELSETSLLEVWLGERRDHEVSLYGPQKNNRKENRKEISTKKKTIK